MRLEGHEARMGEMRTGEIGENHKNSVTTARIRDEKRTPDLPVI